MHFALLVQLRPPGEAGRHASTARATRHYHNSVAGATQIAQIANGRLKCPLPANGQLSGAWRSNNTNENRQRVHVSRPSRLGL